MGDINLLIIGAGEYRENLEKISSNAENIVFAGAQYGDDLVSLVQNSLGLIFPGEEDFGIVPIEIMAAGKPVFALQKGGLTETVLAGKTGDFFRIQNDEILLQILQHFIKRIYHEIIAKKIAKSKRKNTIVKYSEKK